MNKFLLISKEVLIIVGMAIGIFGISALIVFGIGIPFDMASCAKKWPNSVYRVFAGCMVNIDGQYIPEDNVRVFASSGNEHE